jgi:hypothetical protein
MLSAVLHLQHCSPLYIATAVAGSPLAHSYLSPADIAQAAILATARSYLDTDVSQPLLKRSNAVSKFPAWTSKHRPASDMQQLQWQWLLPLQQLQAAFEDHLQDTSTPQGVWCSSHTWQGWEFQQKLDFRTIAGDEPILYIGAFVRVSDLPVAGGSVCSARHKLVVAACGSSPAGQQQGAHNDRVIGPKVWSYTNGKGYGERKLVKLGNIGSWVAAEAKLRELGLVHSDGCLHMTITFTDVV